MKPQIIAITIAMIAVFSMCSAPARADVVDGLTGKWKAANNDTIFEVFPDGSYKSTTNGVVVETGKMNATNGIWLIRADSNRVDKGAYSLNGSELQLRGELVTTIWHRISAPTATSTSAVPTVVTGSFATPASAAPTAPMGTATTTVNTGSVTAAPSAGTVTQMPYAGSATIAPYTGAATPMVTTGSESTTTAPMRSATPVAPTGSDYNERRLNDRQQAIQRFKEEYAARRGAMMRKTPGGIINTRRFMQGY